MLRSENILGRLVECFDKEEFETLAVIICNNDNDGNDCCYSYIVMPIKVIIVKPMMTVVVLTVADDK